LFVAVFVAIWDLVKDGFSWALESVLDIAVSAAQSLDLSGITNNISSFGSIPGNVMQVMGAIGLGQALAVVVSAIGIRFLLQLIPFVRLGS
jgi:hypothetical protein